MQELTLWQNLLVYLLMGVFFLYMFWWWGGFAVIRWIRKKRLSRRAVNPIRRMRVENPDDSWRRRVATGPQSFETYGTAQNIKPDDSWPDQLFEQFPDSQVATYFYAQKLLELAWQARGTGWASGVSDANRQLMLKNLHHADALITQVLDTARVPGDFLLQLLEIDLLCGRRKQAHERAIQYQRALDNRLDVYFKELKTIYPRWGGSHEQLQTRAREIGSRGGLHCAAEAYAWCHLAEDESPAALRKTLQGARLDELVARYQKLPRTPARITGYNDYMTLLAHRTFAALFIHLEQKKLATQALRAISGHFDRDDWVNHYEKDMNFLDATAKFNAW